MPWKPPSSKTATRDPRLAMIRGKSAHLVDNQGRVIATMLLDGEEWVRQLGGHLWWRRWSQPQETLHGYLVFPDGTFSDWVDQPEDLHPTLGLLLDNRFEWRSPTYLVRWLKGHEVAAARASFFGPTDPTT
ncbi:hypothetical protein ACTQ49_14365 [Luteococcus sp. Sow4_B9]|uniref:hypothetical protein n=1 Tax=Luteococcus sp. Sow4_B9 TaxID=3438792 RepID=UPI003F956A39